MHTLKQLARGTPPEAISHSITTEEARAGKQTDEPTPEAAIRNVLNRYELGYDTANLAQVMSCFSETYLSNGRTYQDVQTKAARFFEAHHQIDMTLANIDIHPNIADDTAIVTGIYHLAAHPESERTGRTDIGKVDVSPGE